MTERLLSFFLIYRKWLLLVCPLIFLCTRGDQKVRRKQLSFLHRLLYRAGITAHNTATHMQLIGYNILGVSRLCTLQLSSRQHYKAQTGPFYVAF